MVNGNQIQKPDKRRELLVKLRPEILAEGLLELAQRHDDADDMVERLIATREENIIRFQNKLSVLKRRKEFIEWREARAYRIRLESLLDDIKAAEVDPRTGVELMVTFYENDVAMVENCDDSGGTISDIFSWHARDLFAYYAAQCEDKDWIKDIILRLYEKDDYGLRDSLFKKVTDFLPEKTIRSLIDCLWQLVDKQNKEDLSDRRFIITIQSLAKQLKDPVLLEKCWLAIDSKLPTAAVLEIAQVCLESGDAQKALSWLESINRVESHYVNNCDCLLFAIHSKLNNQKEMADVAWRMFRDYRSKDSLNRVLSVIGENEATSIIDEETAIIHADKQLSYSDARFLVDCGRLKDTERYILERSDNLNSLSCLYRVFL